MLTGPEYEADKARWDAERERIVQKVEENRAEPVPQPQMYKHDPVATQKWTEMQSAMEEWRNSPAGKAAKAAEDAAKAEYKRLSEIDLFLQPTQRGHVRNSRDGNTFYAVLLFAQDENGDGIKNILPMPEESMTRFADAEQEFRVEGGDIGPDDLFEAVEWAETQTTATNWSIMQRVNRRHPASSPIYVFSFSDKESAAMFKMRWG